MGAPALGVQALKTIFVLVDFENVQPHNMGLLKGGPFKIKVFLGASQAKISLEMAQALQTFGTDAEYIQVVGSGKDALDFHIAYYIGRLSIEHPGAGFSIISKDTGFDPLIKHLKAKGVECKRSASIADIPHIKSPTLSPAKASQSPVPAEKKPVTKSATPTRRKVAAKLAAPATVPASPANVRLETVLENLLKRKRALPGTVKTLRSTIQSLFKPALEAEDVDAILVALGKRGKIRIADKKVAYALD